MKLKLIGETTSSGIAPDKWYDINKYDEMTDEDIAHGAWITADNGQDYYVLFNGKESICAHLKVGSYWEFQE